MNQHRTSKVFELTTQALNSGRIGEALRGLRVLAERDDHFDHLCSHASYMRKMRCDADRRAFGAQLKTALDAANMTAELNLAVRGFQLEQDGLHAALEAYEFECTQDNDVPRGWAFAG